MIKQSHSKIFLIYHLSIKLAMVSLAVCFLNSISRLIPKPTRRFFSHYNAPIPNIKHMTLDESLISQFSEIFVIGDVHGCYDELERLLEKTGTSGDDILKIFVGDLVNKGPKSQQVLNLLMNSKSMLSVRGNHDEIVLGSYHSSEPKEKNAWVKDLTSFSMDYLAKLPYSISIPSLNTIIVHAGILPGIPLEWNDWMNMIHMRNVIVTDYFWEDGLVATEDTSRGEPFAKMWGGPQHVYFGHDAKRMLQRYPFATGLDTGCVYGNYLTGMFIHGPRKGQLFQEKAAKVYSEPKGKRKGVFKQLLITETETIDFNMVLIASGEH